MSGLYRVFKEAMMKGIPANLSTLNSGSVFAALIKNTYTFDATAQSNSASASLALASRATDVGGANVDPAIGTPTVSSSGGITFFEGANVLFTSISASQTIAGILLYRKVTNDADSLPIAYINITTIVSNGATINVNWDTGVNRIFSLT